MIRTSIILPLALLVFPATVMARSGNPPDGKTGAPGEGTCRDCHSSYPLNSGNGTFEIIAPDNFEAGQTYAVTVEISDPDQSRWGFEITPLDLGSITITDPTHTQQSTSGGKIYAKQTSAGTYNGVPDGPVSWSFDWTAPDDPPEEVTFYAAGIAANANGNTSGDYVYTTTATSGLLQNIPTLSEWGMILMTLLLMAGGTVAEIRRRHDPLSSPVE
jgi:hypothetical protein